MVFAFRYTRKGSLQAAAFASRAPDQARAPIRRRSNRISAKMLIMADPRYHQFRGRRPSGFSPGCRMGDDLFRRRRVPLCRPDALHAGETQEGTASWDCWSTANGRTAGTTPRRSGGKFVRTRGAVARLGHGRRQAGRRPHARLQGRAGPLPSLCLAGLSVGASHADLPQAEEARGRHLGLGRAPFHGQGRLDFPGRGRRDRRHALRPRLPAPDLHQGRSRPIPAGSRCRCCGTSRNRRSSPTNPPRSSAC